MKNDINVLMTGYNKNIKMTDDQIEAFLELENHINVDETTQILNNNEPCNLGVISKQKKVIINEHGIHHITSDNTETLSSDEQNKIDKIFMEAEKEGKNITESVVKEALAGIPGLKSDDIAQVLNIAKRYKNGENFSIYHALPEIVKNAINIISNEISDKTAKNRMANELIKYMISDAEAFNTIDIARKKMDVEIYNEFKKTKEDTMYNFITEQKQNMEDGFNLKSVEYDKIGKHKTAEECRLISKNFTDSYTLETLLSNLDNNYGKYKIKKIKIEKYKKEINLFNSKYINSSVDNKDISMIIPVLKRHLNDDINDIYTELDIIKFILVFIIQTINMKPEIPHEHVYMYYFIGNILLFDSAISDSDQEFTSIMISNIKKVIRLIREKEKYNDKKNN